MSHSKLREQALRINRRYLDEVVEAFDLCPWADTVRDGEGLLREVFFGARDGEPLRESVLASIESIAAREEIAIGLLIFPELEIDPADFRRLLAYMEARHAAAHERGATPLAMANFHPRATANMESAARLVPFIRRSPDPTIQLVRRSAMAEVRQAKDEGSMFVESLEAFLPLMGNGPKPSVSDNIARNNLRTVERVGVDTIESIHDDIRADRDRAYAACRAPEVPASNES